VHDIVRYAREQKILCQGRGSAANSAVCYVLDVTRSSDQGRSVVRAFISKDGWSARHRRRFRAFAARGGDAICLRRYGRHRAAIIATVIHYRPRSAIRDVGKALG